MDFDILLVLIYSGIEIFTGGLHEVLVVLNIESCDGHLFVDMAFQILIVFLQLLYLSEYFLNIIFSCTNTVMHFRPVINGSE